MYKLAYISVANSIYQDKRNIQSLVEAAGKNNQSQQLTSSLIYSEGHFFHILEGEESVVTDTFSRIRDSKNHRVLQAVNIQDNHEHRLFPDWPLAFSNLSRVVKLAKPENHYLNFAQATKGNQLTTSHQIHEAFFTPLKNGADRFYQDKLVIISDSHAKVATFMNWIADTVKSKISRVEFEDINSSHHLIDYLDFKCNGRPLRVLGFEIGALANPATIPQLMNANHILLLVSGNIAPLADMMSQLSERHLQVIRQSPGVECFFSKPVQKQMDHLKTTLSALDIAVKCSDLQPNNFTEIWQGMQKTLQANRGMAEPAQVAAPRTERSKVQAAPATAALPEQKLAAEIKLVSEVEVKAKKDKSNSDSNSSTIEIKNNTGAITVANIKDSLSALMKIDGAMGCFIADYNSGMLLAKDGGGLDLDLAAAGNTEVIRAKMKVMSMLGIKDTIEDILITLGTQFHIIRPSAGNPGLFLYVVLDKGKANLAMSRYKLAEVEKSLVL